MYAFWMRNREFIVFIIAVCFIIGYGVHVMKPEPSVLHTDTAVLHVPATENQATVPEVAP